MRRQIRGKKERAQLTPSSSSGGAGTGENGAGQGSEHSGTKRKRDGKEDSDDEDWGLEGKSFWKSKLPQSVDTANYVHEQLPLQFKKNIWEGKYCDITLFLPRDNEILSGEKWSVEEGGYTRRLVRPKIKTLI